MHSYPPLNVSVSTPRLELRGATDGMIANQLLRALPSVEPTADDPAYAAGLRDLLAQHRTTRTMPFTEE